MGKVFKESSSSNGFFKNNYSVGDRIKNPDLIETVEGIIMPNEMVTVIKVTDYIIEVLSDRFIPVKFARV